jgi:hypothetical protein
MAHNLDLLRTMLGRTEVQFNDECGLCNNALYLVRKNGKFSLRTVRGLAKFLGVEVVQAIAICESKLSASELEAICKTVGGPKDETGRRGDGETGRHSNAAAGAAGAEPGASGGAGAGEPGRGVEGRARRSAARQPAAVGAGVPLQVSA